MKTLQQYFHKINGSKSSSLYLVLLLICLALYFKCLHNGYSLDDDYIISDVHVKKGLKSAKEIFGSRYISYYHTNYEYRPVTKLVFALQYQLYKLKAGPAHFFNILLYFFNCVLIFRLLLKLKFIPGKAFAFVTVLIFAVHPLHTEVVCSIKNLDVLLSAFFCLSATYLALRFQETKKILLLAFILSLMFLAVLSKLDALPFFGIIPVVLWLNERGKLKMALGFAGCFLMLFLLFHLLKKKVLSDEEDKVVRTMLYHENPLIALKGAKFKLIAVLSSFGFYAEKLLLGFPLICYYGYDTVSFDHAFGQRHIYIGIIAACGLLFLSWKKRTDSLFLFSVLMLVAPISMYLNFPKLAPGLAGDRFAYMAVLGFALLCSYILFSVQRIQQTFSSTKAASALLLLVLLLFSGITVLRSFDWNSHLQLVNKDLPKAPRSAMLLFLKGSFLLEESKKTSGQAKKILLDSSIAYFEKSNAIFNGNASSWNNIGGIHFYEYKDFTTAYTYFKKAYELDPHKDNKILYGKSTFLCGKKQEFYDMAIKEINQNVNRDFSDFIMEFNYFLPKDSLKFVYRDLIFKGLANDTLRNNFFGSEALLADEILWARCVAKAYEFNFREEKEGKDAALILYDNGYSKEASALMDVIEGKK